MSREKSKRLSPTVLGKLRAGRDDGRPSEDDIVRQRLGPRGVPGEPDAPKIADPDRLQISKPDDPGHVA